MSNSATSSSYLMMKESMSRDPAELGLELRRLSPGIINPLDNQSNGQVTDQFLIDLYKYYVSGGPIGTILGGLYPIVTMGIITFLSLLVGVFIDYRRLTVDYNLWNSIDFSFDRITFPYWILILIALIGGGVRLSILIRSIPQLISVMGFYRTELNLSNSSLADEVQWTDIVPRITSRYPHLTPFLITSRIMRYDNYLISYYSNIKSEYSTFRLWLIGRSVWDYILDPVQLEMLIKRNSNEELTEVVARRIRLIGILTLLASPLVGCYLLIYYFLSYFERFRSTPSLIGGRMYSRLAHYHLREYNELPIFFTSRLNRTVPDLEKYLSFEGSVLMSTIIEYFTFLFGSLIAILVIGSLFHNDLVLRTTIWGFPLLSVMTIITVIYVGLRNLLTEARRNIDPSTRKKRRKLLFKVKNRLKYLDEDKTDPTIYYPYRISIFCREIIDLFWAPIQCIYWYPQRAGEYIEFIRTHTRHVPEIGYVCSDSFFDFDKIVNLSNLPTELILSGDKTRRSQISFSEIYN